VSTTKAGTYSLTITDDNSCTSEVGIGTVLVNALPTVTIINPSAVCAPGTVDLTATAITAGSTSSLTYSYWTNNTATTSLTNANTISTTGTYYIKGTNPTTTCFKLEPVTATVNALPTVTITNPSAVCAPSTVDLTATAITAGSTSSLTYSYWTNNTATTSLTNANTISTTGTYYIKGTTALNCSVIKPVNTNINPIPTFTLTSPSVCLGASLTISANPLSGAKSDYNYTWQVPNGAPIPGNISNFTTTIPGVYTATIKNISTNCESASISNTAIFYPLPIPATIVASANKVIVNQTLNLIAAASGGANPYIFTWTPNSFYTISGQENAQLKAIKEGKVNIKYQVKDANNCVANSADYEITIESEKEILIFPNAFTPNGDGNNDIFKIAAYNLLGQASFLYFEIYDRNGRMMGKRIDNINDGWDGKYKDVIQDMGIYFVKIVKMKDGKQVVDNAQFYLIK
jgi:gliding motility-associated-like protein